MGKRAVLYARVAALGSRRRLENQLQMGRKYAQENGYAVVAELKEDAGVSGITLDRRQLNRVREMARAGQFDVLVIRGPDRLSRDHGKLLTLEKELKRAGVEIECIEGPHATMWRHQKGWRSATPVRRGLSVKNGHKRV